MNVDIEYIEYLQAEIAKINNAELKDIRFFKGGDKIDVSPAKIEEFRFFGLSNIHFITTGFYKDKTK